MMPSVRPRPTLFPTLTLVPTGEDEPQPGVPTCGVCYSDQRSRGLGWAYRRAGWHWDRATWHPTGHQATCGTKEKVTSLRAAEEVGGRRKKQCRNLLNRGKGMCLSCHFLPCWLWQVCVCMALSPGTRPGDPICCRPQRSLFPPGRIGQQLSGWL